MMTATAITHSLLKAKPLLTNNTSFETVDLLTLLHPETSLLLYYTIYTLLYEHLSKIFSQ